MLGLNRTGGYLRGFPVLEPLVFGTIVSLPKNFGNLVTVIPTGGVEPQPAPIGTGNFVTWIPAPSHFENPVPLYPTTYVAGGTPPSPPSSEDDILLEDGVTTIELEDGSGNILLEN